MRPSSKLRICIQSHSLLDLKVLHQLFCSSWYLEPSFVILLMLGIHTYNLHLFNIQLFPLFQTLKLYIKQFIIKLFFLLWFQYSWKSSLRRALTSLHYLKKFIPQKLRVKFSPQKKTTQLTFWAFALGFHMHEGLKLEMSTLLSFYRHGGNLTLMKLSGNKFSCFASPLTQHQHFSTNETLHIILDRPE